MTDNFEFWKNWLNKELPERYNDDTNIYFTIHLIKRNKDNKAGTYNFKTFYIDNIKEFDNLKDNIISVCNELKLRAYISVCPKYKDELLKSISKISVSHLCNNEFKRPWNIIENCNYLINPPNDKHIWIIDIDNKSEDYFNKTVRVISECRNKSNNVFIDSVPTKNGIHLFTRPFNIGDYNEIWEREYPDLEKPEIKKNHLSLLYENI